VGALIEVFRAEDLHDLVHQVVVEQNRGEHRLLGLEAVGRNLQERRIRTFARRQPRATHVDPLFLKDGRYSATTLTGTSGTMSVPALTFTL
jgi:hypothetical protein